MTIVLKDVGSGFKRTAINENFDTLKAEINNNLLSKLGGKQLEADLDMNSNNLLNTATVYASNLVLNGTQVSTSPLEAINVTKTYPTLAAAKAAAGLVVGDEVSLAERTTGNGGGGKWDVISGTGTANGIDLVAHDTLSLTYVLRKDDNTTPEQFGAIGDGDGLGGGTNDHAAMDRYFTDRSNIILSKNKMYMTNGLSYTGKNDFRVSGGGGLTLANASNIPVLEFISCSRWTVNDIEIDGNGIGQTTVISGNYGAGLKVYLCADYEISDNYIHHNMSGGGIVCIDGSELSAPVLDTNGRITNNIITNCGKVGGPEPSDGIFANSDRTFIKGNIIDTTTDWGIACDYSSHISILDNKIFDVENGAIGSVGGQYWDIGNNLIDGAGIGVVTLLGAGGAAPPYLSNYINIHHNIIRNVVAGVTSGDGIAIEPNGTNISVSYNQMENCERGIGCSAPNVVVVGNSAINSVGVPFFVSGAGSQVAFNTWTTAGGPPYYGEISNKTVIEGTHVAKTYVSTFNATWGNAPAPWEPVGFYRQLGRVYVVGSAQDATPVAGQPIFTLPVGYRPAYNTTFVTGDGLTGTGIVNIQTTGEVIWRTGTTATPQHLSGVSFTANGIVS